mgnify:FL=1
MELKKDTCCCGATKSKPCACMYEGIMSCSAKAPMCACYKELAAKKGAEIMMKRLKNSNKSIRDKSYNGFDAESFEAEGGVLPKAFNWGDTGLEKHFLYALFQPKR